MNVLQVMKSSLRDKCDMRSRLNKLELVRTRTKKVHNLLCLNNRILEISPNWAPLVVADDLDPNGNITYCDRIDTNALIEREKNNPGRIEYDLEIIPLDFVWKPGETLSSAAGRKFDHVIQQFLPCLRFLIGKRTSCHGEMLRRE